MWLAYQAMLTGDEKYLTQECITLFLSPTIEGKIFNFPPIEE